MTQETTMLECLTIEPTGKHTNLVTARIRYERGDVQSRLVVSATIPTADMTLTELNAALVTEGTRLLEWLGKAHPADWTTGPSQPQA